MIEFNHFTFKYRAQKEPTICDINLKIEKGEKVLIVGPSGSGKSTLANCMNGLVPFSYHGEISGELKIAGITPKQLGIFGMSNYVGTVLQDPDGQFIGLTVGEDIAFSMENDCIKHSEMVKRVNEAADMVMITDLLKKSPYELSGGQKQRVSMAGVLVNSVDVLLFDEPLANLDPLAGQHAIELIDQIHQNLGSTIVIIEHRLEEVLFKTVDRIVLIGEGKIVADMTPNELLATNLLKMHGIREPLYVTALKYAGCELSKQDQLESVQSIPVAKYKEQVKQWLKDLNDDKVDCSDEVVLALEHVNYSYDSTHPIIKDVSLEIKKGEIVSIVGHNGAGKSTLSKLICGFKLPDSGRILYEGKNLVNESIKKRAEHIGMVMQNPNQMISKAMIYDEIALGLYARGWSEEQIRPQVERVLKICGLYPFRNWPISALSFGQKKRVTIASILVLNPDIMILDEPTAGQDFKHYTEIMEFLKKINEEYQITIIIVTHDMHLMLEYTNRTIVLCDGRVIGDSSPAKVLTDDSMIKRAGLKRTSLYDLAISMEIENPDIFVERFISYDRKVRTTWKTS